MAPKRPADAEHYVDNVDVDAKENAPPPAKKARKDASTSKANANDVPMKWQDVELEEDPRLGRVPVYDDCGEIRRKIRLLEKTPGFKLTAWLREIGGINSNSFRRFMNFKERNAGASNGTYLAAYIYFEKNRIAQGKKMSATRKHNESSMPYGFALDQPRAQWAFVGR